MTHWLIDDTGRVWPAQSEALRLRLGMAARPIQMRVDFLITNSGYVSLETLRHGLSIRWRPTFTGRETFAALIVMLSHLHEGRTMIAALGETWETQLLPTLDLAKQILLDQFAVERSEVGGFFVSRPRAAHSLDRASLIARALAAAVEVDMRYDDAGSLWDMVEETLEGRYLLLHPLAQTRRLRIMAHGRGYSRLSNRWTMKVKDANFDEHPDVNYARMAAQGFWAAITSGAPIIEDVDASIWMPSRGRTALHYTRLLLPLLIADQRVILSTSELRG